MTKNPWRYRTEEEFGEEYPIPSRREAIEHTRKKFNPDQNDKCACAVCTAEVSPGTGLCKACDEHGCKEERHE